MGVFSRLNEQQKKQTEAENAMPGAYENRYDESIQNALENMNRQNTAGTGFDGSNVDYRGALSRLFGNAGAGADAAAQTANQLSGGYGASWAQSAADQSAASRAQAGAPSALAKARADALTQWQQELAGQSSQLDSLLGQDQLERGEYDGSVANAQDWRNYQYGRTEQARTEKNDLLSNVWNAVQMVGENLITGYQRYLGYDQWKQEFAYQKEQDAKQDLSNRIAALQQAAEFKQRGMDGAANATLDMYGIDKTVFDNWQGLTDTDKEWFSYASQVQGLGANGYDTFMNAAADKLGFDKSMFESSDALNQKDVKYAAAKQTALNNANLGYQTSLQGMKNSYRSTGTSGRSSGSKSGGSGGTSKTAGYTQPQLNTMLNKYNTMKPTDQSYDYYTETLADAGRIPRLSGTGNPGRSNGTAYEQGMYHARQWANGGYSQSQIASKLANETGLSNDLISSIMNQIDYEWRGTK